MVQLTYPYRTHLAPQPPSTGDVWTQALTGRAHRTLRGGTLSVGLHTGSLPSLHANVGDCWLHSRSTQHVPKARAGRQGNQELCAASFVSDPHGIWANSPHGPVKTTDLSVLANIALAITKRTTLETDPLEGPHWGPLKGP
jgi:hypothetical protein